MSRLIRKRPAPASIAVVRLPAEIDSSNAEHVRERICAALRPGVRVVIADLTATTFCDVAGVRALARARNYAMSMDTEIRLAVGPGSVLRVLTMVSPGGRFSIYPGVGEAIAEHAVGPLN